MDALPKKESEPAGIGSVDLEPIVQVQHEAPLAAEVIQAGVSIKPTTVAIPPAVAQLGVKAKGSNNQPLGQQTIVLPLNDDQITKGLRASITSSIRWLATWCMRRLKQLV